MARTRSAHRARARRLVGRQAAPTRRGRFWPFRRDRRPRTAKRRTSEPGTLDQFLLLLRTTPTLRLLLGLSLACFCLVTLLDAELARQPLLHRWLLPVLKATVFLVLALVYVLRTGKLAEGRADVAQLRVQLARRQTWRTASPAPKRLAWAALAWALRCSSGESGALGPAAASATED